MSFRTASFPAPFASSDRGAEHGLTLLELLIATFIIGTVVVGVFGLFVFNLRTSQEGERRVVAVALANERAEMIRNLPYATVGTVGGIPSGSIVPSETIDRNGLTYTVKTDIRYVDDPFDGRITDQPPDLLNTDYKQARVEVSWNSPSSAKPIILLLQVAPPGIEGGDTAGTLVFQALSATGQAVGQAAVHLTNSTVTPAVDITTSTDDDGYVVLPGLPEAFDSYELAVSKEGYTSEQTYDTTGTFFPDATHAHLSALVGQVTPKTFSIDQVSAVTVVTSDLTASPLPGVDYTLTGTKTIGTDGSGQPVYLVLQQLQTAASGQSRVENLVWDSYALAIDGAQTGYDIKESSLLLPLLLNPADDVQLQLTLVEHQPTSLHVTVVSPAGEAVDNASVRLNGNGYDKTLGTGGVGQVYFPETPPVPPQPLPGNGSYTLEVTAPGYQPVSQLVNVQDTTRIRVELSPTP